MISSHSWATPRQLPPDLQARAASSRPRPAARRALPRSGASAMPLRDDQHYFGFGYGADQNGFGGQGGPRDAGAPIRSPTRSAPLDGCVNVRAAEERQARPRHQHRRHRPLRPLPGLDRGSAQDRGPTRSSRTCAAAPRPTCSPGSGPRACRRRAAARGPDSSPARAWGLADDRRRTQVDARFDAGQPITRTAPGSGASMAARTTARSSPRSSPTRARSASPAPAPAATAPWASPSAPTSTTSASAPSPSAAASTWATSASRRSSTASAPARSTSSRSPPARSPARPRRCGAT